MIRKVLEIRFLFYALIALLLSVCVAEIGLQFHEAKYGVQVAAASVDRLTVPSWQTHHQLRPNSTTLIRNGDSNSQIAIRTNSFGLRGDEPKVPKPDGQLRILCLGDEIVFGGEVPEFDTLTRRLQGFLQKDLNQPVEVLNGGVPGFCPLLSLIQLRSSLALLDADLVVLNFDMSDIYDDHHYRRLVQEDADGQPVGCPNPSLGRNPVANELDLVNRFHVSRLLKDQIGRLLSRRSGNSVDDIETPKATYAWLRDNAPDWKTHIRQALGPIVQLNQRLQEANIPMVLACSPAPWQICGEACNDDVREQFGIAVGEICASRRPFEMLAAVGTKFEIPLFDASISFSRYKKPDRLFLNDSRSFSRYGHALYAYGLAEVIRNQLSVQPEMLRSDEQPVFRQATDRQVNRQ